MRQPDINRANKAKEHIKAAVNLLSSISWVHLNQIQDTLVGKAKNELWVADKYLDDIIALKDQ